MNKTRMVLVLLGACTFGLMTILAAPLQAQLSVSFIGIDNTTGGDYRTGDLMNGQSYGSCFFLIPDPSTRGPECLNPNGTVNFESVNSHEFQVFGRPIAGDFTAGHPGDEIGLFDVSDQTRIRWILDTDGTSGTSATNGFNRLQGGDTVIVLDLSTYPEIVDLTAVREALETVVGS